ncbi:hypothetical protein HMPREF1981_02730 [Bacteroides pyogenes F0041]|uniref:Uncharacterized protein n=1 Tax=Bacteroides pyogenes F0041 TaxID=1321819 RepID=U2CBX7_9BACE|nr:hypothetical protein HMPREF1981_02730 [Bacteroides pyogenes F0041]
MFYRFVYYREMLVETGCQGNWLYFTDLLMRCSHQSLSFFYS